VAAGDGDIDAIAGQPVRPGLHGTRPRTDRADPRSHRPPAGDGLVRADIDGQRSAN